jgi:hypothetical protein
MSPESIIDDSKPNAGRIYDYILGGYHNFEMDRMAAERIMQLLPFTRKYARLQRWALQDIAETLEKRGYDVIIDFASGLPTNEHLHNKVSPKTTVIYSDYDPTVVEYALEIIKDTPGNVFCFQSDAAHPEELLNRPDVQQILQGRRKVAFVYWGVSAFLSDDSLKHIATYLYDWAESGSCLAFHAQGALGAQRDQAAGEQISQMYKRMGTTVYSRKLEEFVAMLQPWQFDENGFVSLLNWHGFDQSDLTEDEVRGFGPVAGGYGAYLFKP